VAQLMAKAVDLITADLASIPPERPDGPKLLKEQEPETLARPATVERIREDLFRFQHGLEKMESLQNVVSTYEPKEAWPPAGLLLFGARPRSDSQPLHD
jgi:hypothetical protein